MSEPVDVYEHANNVYVWLNVSGNCGVEVRAIPMQDGHRKIFLGSHNAPSGTHHGPVTDESTRILTGHF